MASQDLEPFRWHLTDHQVNYSFQLHGQSLLVCVILFSFILLIILLCIYFHFIFRHGLISGVTASRLSSMPPIAVVPAAQSPGIDATTINRLPIFVHRSLATSSDNMSNSSVVEFTECSICLDMFQDEEIVKVLPICHHAYHSVCVDKWLTTQSSCPLCRASLHVDSSTTEPTSL